MIQMIALDQVKHAQRIAPQDEATKQLQRDFARQGAEIDRARRAKKREEERAAEAARVAQLRAQIAALDLILPEGMQLRGFSIRQAQYAGMAPKTFGGWVAIALPRYRGNWFFALVPESWTEGFQIEPEKMRATCLEHAGECIDGEESEILADALAKLSTLTQ